MPYSGQENLGSQAKSTAIDEANTDSTSHENVRTLGSAKYFDDWSGRGAWPIAIGSRAVGDLRQMRKRDGHVFAMVSKKIKELSQGFFSDSNQKRLVGMDTKVPIYEAKVSRDLRIVYQIDLDTDFEAKVDKQIIKLYGIYTHAQMDNRLWSLVSNYHAARRGKEYRRRCSFRETPRTLGNNVTLPAQFPHQEVIEAPIEPQTSGIVGLDYDDADLSAVRSIAASEKFMLMSKSLVKSIVDDLNGGHVFQVSPKEKEVIYYDSACFLLGRSGTGKTTCIVYKMLGIEKMFEWAEEGRPRQVFITQSVEHAQRTQDYYQCLARTDSSCSTPPKQTATNNGPILVELGDEGVELFGLPSRYSLLEDRHFPLFLTFDQLCSLLEEDYKFTFGCQARSRISTGEPDPESGVKTDGESKCNQSYIDDKLLQAILTMDKIKENKHAAVTFEVFVAAYWPHFDRRLIKDLDPAQVYSEFLGVIEGSELTLNSEMGMLSRQQYLQHSRGKSLLSSQSAKIYTLYESYRKIRTRRGGHDAAERTHALIVATRNGRHVPGPKIDALYIDEAQDNLLIDTKLLHNLSNNPHGILMAGDTAQTISAGNSFRFEDLKAFLWRLEAQDEATGAKKRKPIHPALFHLSVNYRSHSGIVDCASSLVELISELFPNSIDKLKKETGLIGGPRPVFFSGWEYSSTPMIRFLQDQKDSQVHFGANQVILVRNDASRDALRAQVGDIGLVLTLHESKGLEFDDALLYNFFEDSVASATTWRIVLNGFDSSKVGPLPQFEEVRHAVICSELKNLYVGLTRARNHCWVLDVSEKAEPIKFFWTERQLIEHCEPSNPLPQLSESSPKSEWEQRGRMLFTRQLYSQAMICFEWAGLTLERDIAAAYETRKQAKLLQEAKSNYRESRAAFHDAAEKFLECSKAAISKQQNSCYLQAADCFAQAEDRKMAAEAFVLGQDFGLAVQNFQHVGCYIEAAVIVKAHMGDIQEGIAREVIKVARLEYLRTGQYERASELFDNLEEQLDYMMSYGFDSGLIIVLEQHKRFEAAAEVAFIRGDYIGGVRLLQSSGDPKLLRRAIEKALQGLWILFPLSSRGDTSSHPAADALIQYLSVNQSEILTEEEKRQLGVFRAISAGDLARIGSLAQAHESLASDSPKNSALSLLCFSRSSNMLIPPKEWTIQDFINTVIFTRKYIAQLGLLARTLDVSSSLTQRLLGVEPTEISISFTEINKDVDTSFRVYSTSVLYDCFRTLEGPSREIPAFNPVLGLTSWVATGSNVRKLASDALYSMLRAEVCRMHAAACSALPTLHICLEFGVFGKCRRPDCRKEHADSRQQSETELQISFNLRVRALIMQISLMDKYHSQTRSDEAARRQIRRTWAYNLYEALMPIFPPFGGLQTVDGASIPELDNGAYSISIWCQQALLELDPCQREERFLPEALVFLDLAFRIDRKMVESYSHHLRSSRLVKARQDLMTIDPETRCPTSIMCYFIDFYHRKSANTIQRALRAIQHVVSTDLTLELNLLVHLLELVGREIIIQFRGHFKGRNGIFDGLVVPQSWGLDIVKRPPLIAQKGIIFKDYLNLLYKMLENIRFYSLSPSTLRSFGGGGPLNLIGQGVLILRICRIIVLVCHNTGLPPLIREEVRLSISSALTGPGEIHRLLCERLAQNSSWTELQDTIIRCPLNRGADRLVRLFYCKNSNDVPPRPSSLIPLVVYKSISDLTQLLSFTGSVQQLEPSVSPQAESNPLAPSPSFEISQTNIPELENDPEFEYANAASFMHIEPIRFDVDGLLQVPSKLTHKLTIHEIESGKIILLAYRKYTLRKQLRQRAVETISKCYSRYLRCRNAPRSFADETYIQFQREYEQVIRITKCSGPLPRSFYKYKAILLGCMPHVMVCLRGLECVNRHQIHDITKRLQRVHHKELEGIQAKMDACSMFTMRLKKLMSAIRPGSTELRDLRVLQTHVRDLERAYREMEEEFGPGGMPTYLKGHLTLGVGTILAQIA